MSAVRLLRAAIVVVFVGGVAGMIIGSIADNNNGVVVTSGLLSAVASVVLIAFTFATRHAITVDEALAAQIEDEIEELVKLGANETQVRHLVRDCVRLGRGQ
jgi:hypothetical protein